MPRLIALAFFALLACVAPLLAAAPIEPDADFPQFIVPGHERAMTSLRNLYWLHYRNNGPMATLWDEWLPPATLWPASGDRLRMRERWAAALSGRHIDAEGYVSTHQHDGTAHANGWPFPLWHQGAGTGWHFVGTGVGGYEPPALATPDGWTLIGATSGPVEKLGWNVKLDSSRATLQPPPVSVGFRHAPFLRLNWRATGLEGATCYVEWTTKSSPQFTPQRRATFAPAHGAGEVRTMIPLYKLLGPDETITALRIGFDGAAPGATIVVKSLHTAYDTRHNINNSNYVRGVASYFNWTRDVPFLQKNMGRARTAMRYAMEEFQTRQRKLVFTPWVGHEGISGVRVDEAGRKTIHAGEGIGSNYWDLMPFGGEDALATIYHYDALRDLADLEQAVAEHAEWSVPDVAPSPRTRGEGRGAGAEQTPHSSAIDAGSAAGPSPQPSPRVRGEGVGSSAFDPADLRAHAAEVKSHAGERFWNASTGRFVSAIDRDGVAHDYGFTFLNTEAIYHGFTTDVQAKSILSWLSGERTITGDTSTGADIYHWRFGPRSTTKRNVGYYFWAWSNPEHIPWGGQVQDGGAVLGWSYHDLMARLSTRGPDDAWTRLRAILTWFDQVQAEGGYRAYYKDPSRGTMQGNNTAGGLGLDAEFMESVLVPQVMLYGFMGFQPTPGGFTIDPRLPSDWPSLTITGIQLHDAVLDITAAKDQVTITPTKRPGAPMPMTVKMKGGASATLEAKKPLHLPRAK
ncbi:MAG: glycosyl hydrolase family 65 protein [Tepidisphaeraceae bacterium]